MKKHKTIFLNTSNFTILKIILILILIGGQVNSFSQETQVNAEITKSKNIVSIDGQKFYIHIVQQGQYLYSLSKTYGVTQEEIIKYNPGVKFGLQTNQAIKIPVKDETFSSNEKNVGINAHQEPNKTLASAAKTVDPFIYHKVDSGQTVYRLSKLYDVPVDTIYFYNPQARTVLKTGDVIRIPKSNEDIQKGTMQYTLQTNFINHQVQKKETLFSLSREYNVSISDLIRNNKELVWGLKYGRTIKIPVIDTIFQEAYAVLNDSVVVDSTVSMTDPFAAYKYFKNICDSASDENQMKKLNIAILLPFQQKKLIELKEKLAQAENIAEEERTVEYLAQLESVKREYSQLSKYTPVFLDFYLGTLIAIDTLKKSGVSVNVQVYDTERDSNKIIDFFTQEGIEDLDLVIGPVYRNLIPIATRFTELYNIPLVSPFSTDSELVKNSRLVFQTVPSKEVLYKGAAKIISKETSKNLIFLYSNDSLSKINAKTLKSDIFSYISTNINLDSVIFKEIIYSDSVEYYFEHTLSTSKDNFVFVMLDDEAVVTNIISKLSFLADNYNITVLGQPKWQSFSNNEAEHFHKLNIQLFSPFYTDYDKEITKQFLQKFRDNFEYEPYTTRGNGENYSFLGYDLTYLFISAIHQYGEKFYTCIGSYHPTLLLADYKFIKYGENKGFENISLSVISYEKNLDVTNYDLIEEEKPKEDIFGQK